MKRVEHRETASDVGQRIKTWRSVRKLSQMELAGRANISARHLSFIETGRGKASPATLLSLASTLQIPLQEQNRLLLAAGFAPRFEEAPISHEKMTHVRGVVEMILKSHDPYPAFAINRAWNIVAANNAHQSFLARTLKQSDREAIGENNILRLLFHPRGLKNHIVNWAQLSRYLLQGLNRQRLTYPSDEDLAELYKEIAAWTNAADTESPPEHEFLQEFAVPMTIRIQETDISLVTTMLKFAAPLSASVEDLTIESFYPADRESEDAIHSLFQ